MKEKERDRKQRWFVEETERARETEREDGEGGWRGRKRGREKRSEDPFHDLVLSRLL